MMYTGIYDGKPTMTVDERYQNKFKKDGFKPLEKEIVSYNEFFWKMLNLIDKVYFIGI